MFALKGREKTAVILGGVAALAAGYIIFLRFLILILLLESTFIFQRIKYNSPQNSLNKIEKSSFAH